ncbi:hypothetical protein QPB89_004546 [Escherichia coli]|nr:hypothetical protein [Escherichia coli]
MKYQIVGGAGLHRSETKTVDMMVKQLPDSWFGYAGLVVTDSQGSMEIDMLRKVRISRSFLPKLTR